MTLPLPPKTGDTELDFFLNQISSFLNAADLGGNAAAAARGNSVTTEETTGGGAIPAFKVVALTAFNTVSVMSSNSLLDTHRIPGITLSAAAAAGTRVSIRWRGEVSNPAWTWTPGLPIYFNSSGDVTQTLPATPPAFYRILGIALTATKINLQPQSALSNTLESELLFNTGPGPIALGTAPADKILRAIIVVVRTAFDVTPTLTIGPSGTPSELMEASDVDLAAVGTYEISPGRAYAVDTPLFITRSAMGSTVGRALLVLEFEPL